jgi:hypothetical protein
MTRDANDVLQAEGGAGVRAMSDRAAATVTKLPMAANPLLPRVVIGDDDEPIPPRQWLLGTTFCKEFVSAIIAAGATGKTALRLAQLIALATGKPITGEHVFRRARVLWVSLEDNENEARRRVRAVRLHHRIEAVELGGWFFRLTLTHSAGKLAATNEAGAPIAGPLAETIEAIVLEHGIELVSFDPFIKAHGAEENDNKAIDEVMQVLVAMADRLGIAFDTTHHTSKGAPEAGNADRGRGASAMKDALRIGKTLTTMTPEEARGFDIKEAERRGYVRYDDAKTNLAPAGETQWFRLVGVRLDNATQDYPNGDSIQAVEAWTPPDAWKGISVVIANEILDTIDAGLSDGERYTDHGGGNRSALGAVKSHVPDKTDAEAKTIIRKWLETGVLERRKYESPAQRKERWGLFVIHVRRPS